MSMKNIQKFIESVRRELIELPPYSIIEYK